MKTPINENKAFILLLAILFASIHIKAQAHGKTLFEAYPNRLITPDYGIVTAADLAFDAGQRSAAPYDPTKDLLARYWQCVPVHAVALKYNPSLGEDSMGPSGVQTLMCDLEIDVNLVEGRHFYGDRRRHPIDFCEAFDRNWRRLTRGESIVCFNGEDPSNETDPKLGKYRSWVWDKFKTRRGCYSYFGDCSVISQR